MREELNKKVQQAIKLIRSAVGDKLVEVCYSGGKDSDVILELAKMSGVNYEAIYKNTSIDPVGTIKHCKEKGCTIIPPKKTFFQLVEETGYPNRFTRFCCGYLKEYKVHDLAIVGVRRCESVKRAKRYKEPIVCRFYTKSEKAQHIMPILEWSDKDVSEFIAERGIKCHPLYYDTDGKFNVKKRLGCVGCPLASNKKRIEQFKNNIGMLKAWLLWGGRYLFKKKTKHSCNYATPFEWMCRELFYKSQKDFEQSRQGLFGKPDYKAQLERIFDVDLTWVDNRLKYEQYKHNKSCKRLDS